MSQLSEKVNIDAGDVIALFRIVTDGFAASKRSMEEARALALKAGHTEAELDAIRDGALAVFMTPLVDPQSES